MSRFAKLTSVDAVEKMAAATDSFKEEATAVLDNLELEIRRATEWIRHDRKEFWNQEVRRGWERVAEARAELERRMTYHSIGDYQPACRDEKIALEKAKRRLRAAEEKVEVVRRWALKIEHELTEYHGAANQLGSWLQSEQPKAIASLKQMQTALQSYLAVQVSTDMPTGGAPSTDASSEAGSAHTSSSDAATEDDSSPEESPREKSADHESVPENPDPRNASP